MNFTGSVSIAANDFVLEVSGCPPSQFGHFFYGLGEDLFPLGDGFLCVAEPIYRLDIDSTSSGTATHSIDYGVPPQLGGTIAAYSTWNFQFWYRDPLGGGTGFNLSDGLSVMFCP